MLETAKHAPKICVSPSVTEEQLPSQACHFSASLHLSKGLELVLTNGM